jgi:ElaB/YqjD/DUF883 family membrane-anchored ribosome-binding protein
MSSKEKENAMTLKSRVADRVSDVVSELEEGAEDLQEHVHEAKTALAGWGSHARRLVGNNPGMAVVGAFAIGFVLAKLARHA